MSMSMSMSMSLSMSRSMSTYVYMSMYMHVYMYVYMCMYIIYGFMHNSAGQEGVSDSGEAGLWRCWAVRDPFKAFWTLLGHSLWDLQV